MKNLILSTLNLSNKIKTNVKELTTQDSKRLIVDQLFFGLSTDQSIELFEKVRIEFKAKMDLRRDEALAIHKTICNYYKEV